MQDEFPALVKTKLRKARSVCKGWGWYLLHGGAPKPVLSRGQKMLEKSLERIQKVQEEEDPEASHMRDILEVAAEHPRSPTSSTAAQSSVSDWVNRSDFSSMEEPLRAGNEQDLESMAEESDFEKASQDSQESGDEERPAKKSRLHDTSCDAGSELTHEDDHPDDRVSPSSLQQANPDSTPTAEPESEDRSEQDATDVEEDSEAEQQVSIFKCNLVANAFFVGAPDKRVWRKEDLRDLFLIIPGHPCFLYRVHTEVIWVPVGVLMGHMRSINNLQETMKDPNITFQGTKIELTTMSSTIPHRSLVIVINGSEIPADILVHEGKLWQCECCGCSSTMQDHFRKKKKCKKMFMFKGLIPGTWGRPLDKKTPYGCPLGHSGDDQPVAGSPLAPPSPHGVLVHPSHSGELHVASPTHRSPR